MKARTAIRCLVLVAVAHTAHAQQAPDGGWHFLIEPYAMFPNMKGETAIGNAAPVPVDEDPQDIFDNLQIGAMLYFEARNDTWALSSDLLYMDLEADIGSGSLVDGTVGVSQLGWELAAMRRIAPWFELGLALTYNEIDADLHLEFNGPLGLPSANPGLTEDWIDPTIVGRATLPLGEKWFFQARANVGGFGVGSELVWQLQADVGYRSSDRWSFVFGYRFIDVDYDHGSGSDRFIYDMQTFGPVLKVGYSF